MPVASGGTGYTRCVDDAMDFAKAFTCLLDDFPHLFRISNICADNEYFAAEFLQCLHFPNLLACGIGFIMGRQPVFPLVFWK